MKAFVLAAALGGIFFATSASAEPPALFVNVLYGHYKNADPWAKGYDPCREYCEADFARLVKAARAKHVIDYDPICQCQKGGEKYMMFSGGQGATDSDYLATIKKMSDPRGGWVLVLRSDGGEWRIRDILEMRGGKQVSLRQRLTAAGA